MTELRIKQFSSDGDLIKSHGWKITKLSGDTWTDDEKKHYGGSGVNENTEDLLVIAERFNSDKELVGEVEIPMGEVNRVKWRVLDCDGNIYAYGTLWGDHWDTEPLDEWAMADLGCTRIQTKEKGKDWKDVV